MNLLITTQAVDKNDPVLGFFHEWVVEFAKHFERVDVICLKEGEYELPSNVFVHSLGKESGTGPLGQIVRFYRHAWKLHNQYDVVFSHMNPHYIVLAGWLWALMGKHMFFWRNHAKMNWMTRVAAFYAKRVFYTSSFACTRVFTHARQMPVGIDTSRFRPVPGTTRAPNSVLFLGRLSPVKRPELFADAVGLLSGFTVHAYGDDPSGSQHHIEQLNQRAHGKIIFHGAVSNYDTPHIYSAFDIYVNLTPEGSMDKTVLEAAACGALVLATNRSFEPFVPERCIIPDASPEGIVRAIETLAALPEAEKESYRKELVHMVERDHSLTRLVKELTDIFTDQKTHNDRRDLVS